MEGDLADILEMLRPKKHDQKPVTIDPSSIPQDADIIIFPGIRYERKDNPKKRKSSKGPSVK